MVVLGNFIVMMRGTEDIGVLFRVMRDFTVLMAQANEPDEENDVSFKLVNVAVLNVHLVNATELVKNLAKVASNLLH